MAGDVVKVRIAGEDLKLPVSLAVLRSLARAKVCPLYLAGVCAIEGRPMVLDYSQTLTVLTLGLQAAGVTAATPETLWKAAIGRDHGSKELQDAGLDYLTAFLRLMPVTEVPPGPEDASPKA